MSEDFAPIVIEIGGDLILDICQEEGDVRFSYRVNSKVLQQKSKYFENLLSDRFKEGQELASVHDALKSAGISPADAPAEALPRVQIVNVGRISKVSTIQNLAGDFLRALHGQDLSPYPPIANLANLAIVADRFDALPHFTIYVQRKKYLQAADAKTKSKPSVLEERVRQKLLIGLLLDHPPWVSRYSRHLILRDSVQWKPEAEESDTAALFWDMPNGIEDEMIQRREYILETINSLQAHFLKLYTSGERQCKLGYDSSVQCDSFQLGEMVRFFLRQGTIRLQGTIYDSTEPSHYSGDIERLLESLRQAPSYQVDRNHAHCGLRVRILPLLNLIETGCLDVGICADCWNQNRALYAWSSAKRPVLWTQSQPLTGTARPTLQFGEKAPSNCLPRHMAIRDMYMAMERDWTAREGYPGQSAELRTVGRLTKPQF